MNRRASTESRVALRERGAAGLPHRAGWLLLIHQIPPTPNYLRVKIRLADDFRASERWRSRTPSMCSPTRTRPSRVQGGALTPSANMRENPIPGFKYCSGDEVLTGHGEVEEPTQNSGTEVPDPHRTRSRYARPISWAALAAPFGLGVDGHQRHRPRGPRARTVRVGRVEMSLNHNTLARSPYQRSIRRMANQEARRVCLR